MEHTNKIAIEILRDEYGDYDHNKWHYDREYKMLVKAQELALNQSNIITTLTKTITPSQNNSKYCPYCNEQLNYLNYKKHLYMNCRD